VKLYFLFPYSVFLSLAQPVGAPEISKKSISQGCPKGGDEMFIIGKNFMKGTVVVFEEVKNDRVIWSAEAEIDQDFFQAVSTE
jgi:nuclear factor of activated T-cells 5